MSRRRNRERRRGRCTRIEAIEEVGKLYVSANMFIRTMGAPGTNKLKEIVESRSDAVADAPFPLPAHRTGSVEQTAHPVTPPPSPSDLPIIGLPALLQLVDWFHQRRLNTQPGGPSCLDTTPPPSPPAPDLGSSPAGPTPPLADTPRREPRPDPERSQCRRGPATREAPGRPGGGA
jgi:hypothetical protein